MTTATRTRLRNIAEIRSFFRTNEQPIYFVGPTGFNLLGLDRWVRNFNYVTYYDTWDGAHPRMIVPPRGDEQFESSEEITNHLLRHPYVQQRLAERGGRPKVAAVFFDAETEEICAELGYDLILPSHQLRSYLDSKVTTTRLGNEGGAPSVPNVITTVSSYDELLLVADLAGLGSDLVVQLPYGDSGQTTFFVAGEDDWRDCADDLVDNEVKVMKRIRHTAAAVEAVITRHGTVVGPFMTDLTGYPELTPYQGGWCGNDLFPEALSDEHRAQATRLVSRLGDRLAVEGYKGFFEVDVLIDLDTDEVYLGELNPRISGASSMTNVTAGAYADIPLFLFHLLEYLDVDYDLDVEEVNERWRELASVDVWSQLIMKEPTGPVERILAAPRTGQWSLAEDGSISFRRAALDWHGLQDDTEFFFLRVYGPGDYRFEGADLGVLVTKGRLQTDDPKELTARCRRFIEAIRARYVSQPPLSSIEPALPFSALGTSAL
ncbi:biotin carboxylase [Nocardioides ungokensis]|uniref:biotin carboxylase n=1 Tax=Nocardioides ungokensis TaxID=1643322 RepID=UPI0015DED735|nr:biotin carboxylase [Nocardioides ungokensis]